MLPATAHVLSAPPTASSASTAAIASPAKKDTTPTALPPTPALLAQLAVSIATPPASALSASKDCISLQQGLALTALSTALLASMRPTAFLAPLDTIRMEQEGASTARTTAPPVSTLHFAFPAKSGTISPTGALVITAKGVTRCVRPATLSIALHAATGTI